MQLLQQDASLLTYGGTAQYKVLGIGLLIAWIAFGLLPFVLFLRNRQVPFLIFSIFGLILLIGGIWALSYRQFVIFDKSISSISTGFSNIFQKSEQRVLFTDIREIGIRRRVYSSATSQTTRQLFFMEFRLADGSTFKLEDDDFNGTEEQARKRASELAAFCGTVVK